LSWHSSRACQDLETSMQVLKSGRALPTHSSTVPAQICCHSFRLLFSAYCCTSQGAKSSSPATKQHQEARKTFTTNTIDSRAFGLTLRFPGCPPLSARRGVRVRDDPWHALRDSPCRGRYQPSF